MRLRTFIPLLAAVVTAACTTRDLEPADSAATRQAGDERAAAQPASWSPPALSELRDDSLGASVRRGLALLMDTRDSLPRYARSNLNCTSCHLDGGRRANAASLAGVHGRYPRYMARTGAVVTLADRVNYCFTRSLAGTRLPSDSREMQDILAYFWFLSRGAPVGSATPGEGMPPMHPLAADSARGRATYAAKCSICHGARGEGIARAPALWGARSYSIGASMARVERAASFIKHNMPLSAPGSLTDQEAWDLAAFVNAQPRPDSPGKHDDYPAGDAPADVPYDTKGHRGYDPPPLLARAQPAASVVPAPPRAPR